MFLLQKKIEDLENQKKEGKNISFAGLGFRCWYHELGEELENGEFQTLMTWICLFFRGCFLRIRFTMRMPSEIIHHHLGRIPGPSDPLDQSSRRRIKFNAWFDYITDKAVGGLFFSVFWGGFNCGSCWVSVVVVIAVGSDPWFSLYGVWGIYISHMYGL